MQILISEKNSCKILLFEGTGLKRKKYTNILIMPQIKKKENEIGTNQ